VTTAPDKKHWRWRDLWFEHAFTIEPQLSSGIVAAFQPHLTHAKALTEKPHPHGTGPFCEFRVPPNITRTAGVYVFTSNDRAVYVGRGKSIRDRLRQYHRISGRQCYAKGPRTTCHINAQIYQGLLKGALIQVYALTTEDYASLEIALIHDLGHPPWNLSSCRICAA
jgi:hypothetical protein